MSKAGYVVGKRPLRPGGWFPAKTPRDDASGHKSIGLSIISSLLKVFLFGIRTKLTNLWGN